MARPVIAVTDSVFPSLDLAMAALARLDPQMRMSKSAAADDILAVARDADAILVTYAKLPAELLRQLQRCKAIGRFGLGVDNIDTKAAAELGITVSYVPDYCMHEVSDHAMALLLALARKIPFSNTLVQSGRWEMPAVAPLRRIAGQVLGLVGFGNIPRALAPKAKAFGYEVIAYDPYAGNELFAACGVEAVSFESLLARADAISVHAPLTPATRGLIDAAAFARMKQGRRDREHRARPAHRRAGARCGARQRQARRRRARCGGDRAAAEGFSPARPPQRHPDAAYRVLLGRGARGAADQVRRRRGARAQRPAAGLSGAGRLTIRPGVLEI